MAEGYPTPVDYGYGLRLSPQDLTGLLPFLRTREQKLQEQLLQGQLERQPGLDQAQMDYYAAQADALKSRAANEQFDRQWQAAVQLAAAGNLDAQRWLAMQLGWQPLKMPGPSKEAQDRMRAVQAQEGVRTDEAGNLQDVSTTSQLWPAIQDWIGEKVGGGVFGALGGAGRQPTPHAKPPTPQVQQTQPNTGMGQMPMPLFQRRQQPQTQEQPAPSIPNAVTNVPGVYEQISPNIAQPTGPQLDTNTLQRLVPIIRQLIGTR